MDIVTKVCRICLMQNDLQSIYEITIEGKTIPEILSSSASIQIDETDQLTKGICANCINRLTECYTFLCTCKESNEVLLNSYKKYLDNKPEKELETLKSEKDEDVENIVIFVDTENSNQLPLENIDSDTAVVENVFVKETQEEQMFTCGECKNHFDSLFDISNHYKTVNHENSEYLCPICKLFFDGALCLSKHIDRHIDDVHKCTICGKVFKYLRSLKSHMVLHVGRTCSYEVMIKDEPNQCEDGCKILAIKEIKERNSTFKCIICSKFFASEASMKNHLTIHTQPSLKCELCGKLYHNKYKLSEHVKDHTETRRFHCEVCKKEFKKLVNLKAHKLIHLGVKPHKCPVCSRCFTQQQQLKAHLRTHTKEKPFICEFCSKSFALKGNLVVHRRMHTLDYPYICDICNNGYPDSSSLKRHRKTHEKIIRLAEDLKEEMESM